MATGSGHKRLQMMMLLVVWMAVVSVNASFFKKTHQPPLLQPWDVGVDNNRVERLRRIYKDLKPRDDYYDGGRIKSMVKKVGEKMEAVGGGDDDDDDTAYGSYGDVKNDGLIGYDEGEKKADGGQYGRGPFVKNVDRFENFNKPDETKTLQQLYNSDYAGSEASNHNSYVKGTLGLSGIKDGYHMLGSGDSYDSVKRMDKGRFEELRDSNVVGNKQKKDRWQGFCFKRTRSGRRLPYICWRQSK